MRIFAFHLLNDFSGSPKVLSQLVKGWSEKGLDVQICSSFSNQGFLSDIPREVSRKQIWYRYFNNKILRLAALLTSQLLLAVTMFFRIRRDDIIYVNTVLPFGAALLGKAKGARVIYHMHETSMKPLLLKRFLFGIVKLAADEIIYVSEYLAKQEPLAHITSHVLHNAIPDDFLRNAGSIPRDKTMPQNVLMVCSLKEYKGVREFVLLADRLPAFRFRMVMNSSLDEIETFFADTRLPRNLEILPTQRDVTPHYAWADLVVNLSRPDGWVETFGLTIIEGMAFGIPAIVPCVGGITEVVEDGYNGYLIDSRNLEKLEKTISELFLDSSEYSRLSDNAKKKLEAFREQKFIRSSLAILRGN